MERKQELARDRPDFVDTNARTLFLGMTPAQNREQFSEADVHAMVSSWIQSAALVKLEADPVVSVRTNSDAGKFAFVEFRTPEMATACLSSLGGLKLQGWGEVKFERPKVYDPAVAPHHGPSSAITLDVSRLKHVKSEPSKAARQARIHHNKNHYRAWKKEQKTLKTGETGQQLRERYLRLFPERN